MCLGSLPRMWLPLLQDTTVPSPVLVLPIPTPCDMVSQRDCQPSPRPGAGAPGSYPESLAGVFSACLFWKARSHSSCGEHMFFSCTRLKPQVVCVQGGVGGPTRSFGSTCSQSEQVKATGPRACPSWYLPDGSYRRESCSHQAGSLDVPVGSPPCLYHRSLGQRAWGRSGLSP